MAEHVILQAAPMTLTPVRRFFAPVMSLTARTILSAPTYSGAPHSYQSKRPQNALLPNCSFIVCSPPVSTGSGMSGAPSLSYRMTLRKKQRQAGSPDNMIPRRPRKNKRALMTLSDNQSPGNITVWRKGWDSNPRTGSSPITRFRVERVTASSLPFHKRVLYTKTGPRASLFSGPLPQNGRPHAASRRRRSRTPCASRAFSLSGSPRRVRSGAEAACAAAD